jgi:hypothetical protein
MCIMAADLQSPDWKALQRLLGLCERTLGASARVWLQRHHGRSRVEVSRIAADDERSLDALRVAPMIQAEGSFPTLRERILRRVTYQEARRHKNLEDVCDGAVRSLPLSSPVSDEPVDEDWAARFFAIVQDVSYAPMKELWGRLLAAEVRRPGSFSMRCLDVLRSLTRLEAGALGKLAPFVVNQEAILRSPALGDLLLMREFHALVDAGIVGGGSLQWELPAPDALISLPDVLVQMTGGQPMTTDAWRLTGVGTEIVTLLEAKASRPFLRWLLEEVGARDYRCTLHRMVSRDPLSWDPRPTRLHEI